MTDRTNKKAKRKLIWYWITTGLLLFGMVSGGIGQMVKAKFNVEGMLHLGYPLHTMQIIRTWKILGAVALLIPGYVVVKEWAYAGFFFVLTGAVVSHLATGDPITKWIAPSVFAVLTVLSWHLRPTSSRVYHLTNSQADENDFYKNHFS